MFDLISSTYDRTNRILSFGMDQKWRRQVARSLPDRPNLQILDLATGTGDQILALLQSKAPIQSITGIDLSSEMLEIAKTKLQSRAQFLLADAQKLPFPDASFDAATFSFGIRNVINPLLSLQDIYRVLKPAGRCLILEFSLPPKPIRGFYLFYLRTILPRLGGLLSRNRAAYRYLNQTIEHFPSGQAFSDLMAKAGFAHLKRIPLSLGGVTLYVGEKEYYPDMQN
jgi:demethylmenaquinone methyltransferase/2-methoxy-6-polyprenyl-1,4-benzoquinol methylase